MNRKPPSRRTVPCIITSTMILTVLWIQSVSAHPDPHEAKETSQYHCGYSATIRLDGRFEDWPKAAVWDKVTHTMGWNTPREGIVRPTDDQDASFEFACIADEKYLYVAVKIYDDKKIVGEDISDNVYLDDSIEFYIDGDNSKSKVYEPDVGQITIGRYNVGTDVTHPRLNAWKGTNGKGIPATATGTMAFVADTDTGWIVEGAIPLDVFGIQLKESAVIGFNVQLNDDDDGGKTEHKLSWSNIEREGNTAAFRDPSVFGELKFTSTRPISTKGRTDAKSRQRMRRWRNVIYPESHADPAIREIDALEDEIGELQPNVERIRALISRIDPLSHYKTFENVRFLLKAVGELTYPGIPAVDVLWRHGQIDDEWREQVKQYIFTIEAWLNRTEIDEAKSIRADCAQILDEVYESLGDYNDEKRWLAMSLAKTLKEHAYTAWDFISEYDDETFVKAVYLSILDREPSPDDLRFRVEELTGGKSREDLFREVFDSLEHKNSHLHSISERLKR